VFFYTDKPAFNVGDLVWGRVEGHPWWPALVTPSPSSKKHFRDGALHLQFFEENPTRAWVKHRSVFNQDRCSINPLGISHTQRNYGTFSLESCDLVIPRFVQGFTGSKSGPVAFLPDPDWKQATLDANDALTMSLDRRLRLIRDFPASDNEMDAESEKGMNYEHDAHSQSHGLQTCISILHLSLVH
jgi:hypothetical protein